MTNPMTEWRPIKLRPLTGNEQLEILNEWNEMQGYEFDCPVPADGEEVLITSANGEVVPTEFYVHTNPNPEAKHPFLFEFDRYAEEDVIAWMPLPKPYVKED